MIFSSVMPSVSSVQSLSHVRLFVTPWIIAHQASLSITQFRNLCNHVHWAIDAIHHIIVCRPFLLPPSIFPTIRVFSNESALCIKWSKYWSFSFNIRPSNEYSRLISFRIDWFDLLAFQGTPKSLHQHQFECINSSAFSLFYAPTLISIHDYWKKP